MVELPGWRICIYHPFQQYYRRRGYGREEGENVQEKKGGCGEGGG
jgi:hypothetical protein